MKKNVLLLILIGFTLTAFAQIRRVNPEIIPLKVTPLQVIEDHKTPQFIIKRFKMEQEKWFRFNQLNLNLSEVALSNWSAGGNSSLSGLMNAKFRRRYSEEIFFWDNELEINYGVNIQEKEKLRKTDDKMTLTSSFGYRGKSKSYWYFSSQLQLTTQLTNGYSYPNREVPISKFLAPGYIYLGSGAEYAPKGKKFNLFLSPLTLKTTLVLDQTLADKGAFGVDKAVYDASGKIIKPGKNSNSELGFMLKGSWEKRIAQNINMNNVFNFYGDYLEKFGNIDIDWEMNIHLKVNNYVQARLGTHIRYDDDVKFKSYKDAQGKSQSYGARTQFKQILGVGILYTF
ncbi:conserved exported hypothetical protein [Capnocytophaga canimorsus]|uniref:Uncharacterized protein n=1 Tax=Capnocytophaga canimorsus TaxID=28188 RepID=A0A0B7HMG2_9FLAO|nr:DUF3078 domain-containing protein [Capnocytophaga canimorsus]ATA76991.1 DUF3078 domain-containing protein [Capnocytophaga canimorsus]PJI83877.1 Protein of unknown function (DUF3078) [Capnocytophaga canimorsus]CEN40951.1 conserved exported hypothetical protein [Capnocytophaga canimorsus]STA72196.1 Protein of uncharacterised function (DUF3078) [Capnocytophaga canimorsus]